MQLLAEGDLHIIKMTKYGKELEENWPYTVD
jgi:hypothetical protein